MSLIETNIVAFGHGSLNPSYFCVHSTANVGATAYNHVDYWRNNPMSLFIWYRTGIVR